MRGCIEFEEAIALHAAGGLDGPEREALLAHLADCAGCAAELQATRELLGEFSADTPALPAEREAAFAARVREAAERAGHRAVTPLRPRRWSVPARMVAAAGALAAAAALVVSFRAPDGDGRIAAEKTLGAEEALASELAAAGDEALDLLPEDDLGLDALSDDELLAVERLLAANGG
jgi:anti-sigma factor RsiW